MAREKVLVVGAGIAGSVCAYWLAKHDFEVTVVERSKTEQRSGQGLEIEEPAFDVVKAMGILSELKTHRTEEKGFKLEDATARPWATLDAGGPSPTGALELMRGDLTEVLYKAADASPNVIYRFETTLQALRQSSDKVTVDLQYRPTRTTTTEDFDLVIAADGQRSRTRQLTMGTTEELGCFKPVGAHVAYFSINKQDADLPYSKACHFPGRRLCWIRPVSKDSPITSAYLMHITTNAPAALREANHSSDRAAQKAAWADVFGDCGWQMPRIIDDMKNSSNFYSEELCQVKLPTWHKDRVVLLGDSAWAPTPFTGQGNQLAIIGGFVLAQELSRNRSPVAFQQYDSRLRKYVADMQSIPLNGYAPFLLVPETKFGIGMVRWFLAGISSMVKVVSYFQRSSSASKPSDESESADVPGIKKNEDFDLQMERKWDEKVEVKQ